MKSTNLLMDGPSPPDLAVGRVFAAFLGVAAIFFPVGCTAKPAAPPLQIRWTATYNSPANGADVGEGVAVDGRGNVYVAGYEDRSDLGQGKNIWVRKYDATGRVIWTNTYNSPTNSADEGRGVAVDGGGNVYVAGYEDRSDLAQRKNIWVRKYDTDGRVLWTATDNSPANRDDFGRGIAVDGRGNVYVTGSEDRSDLGQDNNVWVRKYDTNGQALWTATDNSPANRDDVGWGIAVDGGGNVYVAGSEARSDLGQGYNIWVRKYDTDGRVLWTNTYNSPANSNDVGWGIAVDGSGTVSVSGSEARTDLDQGHNIWVRKYDTDGRVLWTATYDSPASRHDIGWGIAMDGSGNVYVTGVETRSDLDQGENVWVRKYDTNGQALWTTTDNSPDNGMDQGRGIAVDGSGNVSVTGSEKRSDLGQDHNIWVRTWSPAAEHGGTH